MSSDLATFCLHESHLYFDSRLLFQSRLTEHQPGGRVCVSIPGEDGRRRDRCEICFQSSSPWAKLCLSELPAQEQPPGCAAHRQAHVPSLPSGRGRPSIATRLSLRWIAGRVRFLGSCPSREPACSRTWRWGPELLPSSPRTVGLQPFEKHLFSESWKQEQSS